MARTWRSARSSIDDTPSQPELVDLDRVLLAATQQQGAGDKYTSAQPRSLRSVEVAVVPHASADARCTPASTVEILPASACRDGGAVLRDTATLHGDTTGSNRKPWHVFGTIAPAGERHGNSISSSSRADEIHARAGTRPRSYGWEPVGRGAHGESPQGGMPTAPSTGPTATTTATAHGGTSRKRWPRHARCLSEHRVTPAARPVRSRSRARRRRPCCRKRTKHRRTAGCTSIDLPAARYRRRRTETSTVRGDPCRRM